MSKNQTVAAILIAMLAGILVGGIAMCIPLQTADNVIDGWKETYKAQGAELAKCRLEIAKAHDESLSGSTLLLEPANVQLLHGLVTVTPGSTLAQLAPLAANWVIPGNIVPRSNVPGRSFMWVGADRNLHGPFVAPPADVK